MSQYCSPAYSCTFRLRIPNRPGMLALAVDAIGAAGGDLGVISIVDETREELVRDITVRARDHEHQLAIREALKDQAELEILGVEDCTYACHRGGKLEVTPRTPLRNAADLAKVYTPGVARVCRTIAKSPREAYCLTVKGNCVAVVSDGSAVLGLGDIGPLAALPVMEGKAILFKEFGGVDAFPICLQSRDTEEIIATVKAIAPSFGGINLEDIAAPRCFEIERRLQEELDIPVFHDDQHGTAIVTLAALSNALKLIGKEVEDIKIVFCGVGAAGMACTRLLMASGVRNIVGCDRRGAIHTGREDELNPAKRWYAEHTNPEGLSGGLSEVIVGADVFVGLSGPGILSVDDVRSMARDPIVFAMANPEPEIDPDLALPYVAVMATGRSDYPNQINNVLAFPGVFRGALQCRASRITEGMKLAAAQAIAAALPEASVRPDRIIPSAFREDLAGLVARAVREAALREGVGTPCPAADGDFEPGGQGEKSRARDGGCD